MGRFVKRETGGCINYFTNELLSSPSPSPSSPSSPSSSPSLSLNICLCFIMGKKRECKGREGNREAKEMSGDVELRDIIVGKVVKRGIGRCMNYFIDYLGRDRRREEGGSVRNRFIDERGGVLGGKGGRVMSWRWGGKRRRVGNFHFHFFFILLF